MIKLIDFTNKSQFEVEFYMKQHQLNYKIERDFHKKNGGQNAREIRKRVR